MTLQLCPVPGIRLLSSCIDPRDGRVFYIVSPRNLIIHLSRGFCVAVAEKKAHREWHRSRCVPRKKYSLCARHDCIKLSSRLHCGPSGQPLLWQCSLQGNPFPLLLIFSCRYSVVSFRNSYTLFHLTSQVSVTARDDVPFFGPALPNPAVFKKVWTFRSTASCKD